MAKMVRRIARPSTPPGSVRLSRPQMPGQISRQAARRIQKREEARLVLSKRLQVEMRLSPHKARPIADYLSATLTAESTPSKKIRVSPGGGCGVGYAR